MVYNSLFNESRLRTLPTLPTVSLLVGYITQPLFNESRLRTLLTLTAVSLLVWYITQPLFNEWLTGSGGSVWQATFNKGILLIYQATLSSLFYHIKHHTMNHSCSLSDCGRLYNSREVRYFMEHYLCPSQSTKDSDSWSQPCMYNAFVSVNPVGPWVDPRNSEHFLIGIPTLAWSCAVRIPS